MKLTQVMSPELAEHNAVLCGIGLDADGVRERMGEAQSFGGPRSGSLCVLLLRKAF